MQGIWTYETAVAACRTIAAPRWKLWLSKLLGAKIVTRDSGYTVVAYQWRGKLYVHDFIKPE